MRLDCRQTACSFHTVLFHNTAARYCKAPVEKKSCCRSYKSALGLHSCWPEAAGTQRDRSHRLKTTAFSIGPFLFFNSDGLQPNSAPCKRLCEEAWHCESFCATAAPLASGGANCAVDQ